MFSCTRACAGAARAPRAKKNSPRCYKKGAFIKSSSLTELYSDNYHEIKRRRMKTPQALLLVSLVAIVAARPETAFRSSRARAGALGSHTTTAGLPVAEREPAAESKALCNGDWYCAALGNCCSGILSRRLPLLYVRRILDLREFLFLNFWSLFLFSSSQLLL